MAIALDVGTMFLCRSEEDQLSGGVSFTSERNCFLEAASTIDTEQTLKDNNWSYAKHENKYYILGEDAIKLKNLLTVNKGDADIVVTKVGDLRRPMKDGLLNTGEDKLSIAIIERLISNLLGAPKHAGEKLCFCVPGDPVDRNIRVLFHQSMLTRFLKGLGYDAESIPEALAIIFSERPVVEDPDEENGEAPFSGISFSYGSGMQNVCMAYKKLPLINFSIARSGDFIDEESAKVAGVPVSTITRFKETSFDLNNVDYSDIRQAALDIFYQNVIEYGISNFAEKFRQTQQNKPPMDIVVAGGTASVPGFIEKFKTVLEKQELPFKVKSVRLAKNPLYTVANGCLLKAISMEKAAKTATKNEDAKDTKENNIQRVKIKSQKEPQ